MSKEKIIIKPAPPPDQTRGYPGTPPPKPNTATPANPTPPTPKR